MKDDHEKPQSEFRQGYITNSQNSNTDPLWTVEDVALYLRLESNTVRSMVREGKLPAMKVGRVYRFQRSTIQKWLSDQIVSNSEE